MTSHLTRLAAAVIAATRALAPTAARAETSPSPAPSATESTPDAAVSPSPVTSDDSTTAEAVPAASAFDTFASAMLGYYAAQSGLGRDAFVARNATTLGTFLGIDAGTLARTGFTTELRDQLTGSLFEGFSGTVSTPEITLDTAVTLRGAKWAKDMLTLRYDTIKVPKPSVGGSKQPKFPSKEKRSASGQEELMFGLMYNTSMAELVKSSPDLFAQVASAGVGSPEAAKAFKGAMATAYSKSSGDLSRMFPSPCSAAFLTALSSGSASKAGQAGGSACQPCVVSGIYAHSQMTSAFAGTAATAPEQVAPTSLQQLPSWQRDVIAQQNPSLSTQLSSSVQQPAAGCSSSSPAVTGTLTEALPGIFSSLRPR